MDNKTSWHQVLLGVRCAAPHHTDRSGGLAWPDGRLVYPLYFYAHLATDIPGVSPIRVLLKK